MDYPKMHEGLSTDGHIENAHSMTKDESVLSTNLKLDNRGVPVRPQPTEDPADPLNWPSWLKHLVVLQVSINAFLGPFSSACINSAFSALAQALGISIREASYSLTVPILFSGLSPFLFSPLSNVYGRRPIYIFAGALGIAAQCATGASVSWAGNLTARIFMAIGTSGGMGIGGATVADIFFEHERGKYMGLYIIFLTNGGHVAGLTGLGYKWCYWFPAIVQAVVWLFNLFFLPETLYDRGPKSTSVANPEQSGPLKMWPQLLALWIRKPAKPFQWREMINAVKMLKYPAISLTILYNSTSHTYGTALVATTGAATFGSIYHFDVAQIGMAIGISTIGGSLLAELLVGPLSDHIFHIQIAKRPSHETEVRLHGMWLGTVILPAGLIITGICLQYKTHWMGPCVGIACSSFGTQIVCRAIIAYCADSYRPQATEISCILNFGRQTFSFALAFYALPLAHETTFGVAWGLMAAIQVITLGPVLILFWRGHSWRERLGTPDW